MDLPRRTRRSALATVTDDEKLAPMWRRLERKAIDGEFFRAYFRSDASYGRRNLLLRMALDDERRGATNRLLQLRLKPALLRRIVMFLESDPAMPLDPFASRFSKDVPTHLRSLFGNPAMSDAEFARRAIILPYVRAMTGAEPFPGISGAVAAAEARRILAPAARRVLLAPADADRFLSERDAKSTSTTGRFFFDTGSLALDVRNVLQFAAVLFAKTGHGGRLQSRLPTALLARIGIRAGGRHVSIPDLLLATDLLALAILGLLHKPAGRRLEPLARTIEALLSDPPPAFPDDLRKLARRHFQRTLLDRAASSALCVAQDRGRWERMYDSGLLFNLERLVGEDAVSRRFAGFSPFYRCVDDSGLRREILVHFRRIDPAFGGALRKLMRIEPEEFEGIKARSLANVIFHARWLESVGEKPGARLPSVAKYRVGVLAPVDTGARSGRRRRRRRSGLPARRPVLSLPLLERLSKKAPILDV